MSLQKTTLKRRTDTIVKLSKWYMSQLGYANNESVILMKFSSLAVPEIIKMITANGWGQWRKFHQNDISVSREENFIKMTFPFLCRSWGV